jgi:hypothetical protein
MTLTQYDPVKLWGGHRKGVEKREDKVTPRVICLEKERQDIHLK